jgi:4-amino-4-deoxy-L-arabinose transferase-like glycosyltransferase
MNLSYLLHSNKLLPLLILLTFSLHLLPAVFTPLSVDEAHYALYGYFPALSYFDHPPLVGWLQAIALQWGSAEWQLRIFALLCYTLTLWLIHAWTAYHYQSPIIANIAAIGFVSIPLTHSLGIALVPDTLLLPLAIALIWQAQRTLTNPSWQHWLTLGLLLGLSALSKYTSVLLAVGLLAVLVYQRAYRHLFTPGFWLAIAVAGLMTLPVLYWNMQHDWISINYQLNHGQPSTDWQWLKLLQSQTSQLLVYTPLIWFAAWRFMLWPKTDHAQIIWTALFLLPMLLLFTYASGKEPSLPHWLALFYVLWLPSIANWLWQQRHKRWLLFLASVNTLLGLTLSLILTLLLIFPSWGNSINPNPARDLIGWKEAAMMANTLKQSDEVIFTLHWVDSSRIAWYTRPTPVIVLDDRYDQFDLWFGFVQSDMHGILILPPERSESALSQFSHCQPLAATKDNFRLYRCSR